MDIFSQRALRLFRVIFHQSFSGSNPSFNKRFPRQELAGLSTQDMGGVDINVWLATIRENSKIIIEVWTRTGQLEPIIMAWVLTKHPAGFVEASCIWWVKCRCWGLSRGKYLRFQSSKRGKRHYTSYTYHHLLVITYLSVCQFNMRSGFVQRCLTPGLITHVCVIRFSLCGGVRYRVWMTSLWCHVGILPRLQRVINSVIMYDPHASYQQSQSRNTCCVLILSNTCSSIYIPNRRSYGFTAYYNHPHLMQTTLRTVAVWAVSTVAKYLQS